MPFETNLLMLWGNTLFQWAIFAAIIIASILAGKLIDYAIGWRLKKIAAKGPARFKDIVLSILEKPLWLIFVIIGVYIGLGYLALSQETVQFVHNINGVIVILVISWIVIRTIDNVLKKYLVPIMENAGTKIDDRALPIISRITKVLILAIAIAAIVASFGYDITAVIAGLGIGGIAIAFAAQTTIADVFGGLSIFASKHFVAGDSINFENKVLHADQIGLRYSRFTDLEGNKVIIPNSKIAGNIVTNLTSEASTRVISNIGITYNTPSQKITKAKKILREIIESEEKCTNKHTIVFSEFKDWSLNIMLVYYIKDRSLLLEAKDSVNLKIKERFDKEGIEFAFPTQKIYLAK